MINYVIESVAMQLRSAVCKCDELSHCNAKKIYFALIRIDTRWRALNMTVGRSSATLLRTSNTPPRFSRTKLNIAQELKMSSPSVTNYFSLLSRIPDFSSMA